MLLVGIVIITARGDDHAEQLTPQWVAPDASPPTSPGSCCAPDGSFICDGPCFVNGATLNSSERNVLNLFGPGGVFLNNTVHNTKTAFTENEVFTALPNDCHSYTGATVWRSDVQARRQVVLEKLFFSDDCSSFTKVVTGQQLPGPLTCKISCQRESVDAASQAMKEYEYVAQAPPEIRHCSRLAHPRHGTVTYTNVRTLS